MKRIIIYLKHHYYSFLINRDNKLHPFTHYYAGIGHRITGVYTLHSWDELDGGSRDIHLKVARDTSHGNHGGY